MNKIITSLLLMLLAKVAMAGQYFVEIEGAYLEGELPGNIDYDGYAGRLTAYMNFIGEGKGVSLDEGAYAESGFLSQASSITIDYSELDRDDDRTVDEEGGELRLVVGYGSIIELSGMDDLDTYSLAFGSYWGDRAATVVRLTKMETDFDSRINVDPDPFIVTVDTHVYVPLRSMALSYDVEVGWVTSDADDENAMRRFDGTQPTEKAFSPLLGGGINFYPHRRFGVGVDANWTAIGDVDKFDYNINLNYFPAARLGISLDYKVQELGNGIGKIDESLSISLTGRI